MPSLIEFRFLKTKKNEPIIIKMDEDISIKNLKLWMIDILTAIEPLSNPLTIEDILHQTKRFLTDQPYEDSMVYLAVGGLLADRYLEIINF